MTQDEDLLNHSILPSSPGKSIAVFYLLGMASLTPWNFLITPKDYWLEKFSTNASTQNQIQTFWESSLSVCAMLPTFTFSFLTAFGVFKQSATIRVFFALIVTFACLVINQIFVFIPTRSFVGLFFTAMLVIVMIINSVGSVLITSTCGMAAKFGEKHIQANLVGQSLAGILAAVADIGSLSFVNDSEKSTEAAAFGYFSIAVILIVLTFFAFKWLTNSAEFESIERKDDLDPLISISEISTPTVDVMKIIKTSKIECFQIFATLFVTLSVFPSIASDIEPLSVSSTKNVQLWKATFVFLLFNIGDTVGRTLGDKFGQSSNKHSITILVLARGAFLVLIPMCNVPARSHSSTMIHSDAVFILFMAVLSVTNGYFSTLCMIRGVNRVQDELGVEYVEPAGALFSLPMSAGLFSGACFSFFIQSMI